MTEGGRRSPTEGSGAAEDRRPQAEDRTGPPIRSPDLTDFLGRHEATKLYRFAQFTLVSHGGGEAVMECPVVPETMNVNGDLHGGILALLVDEAGTVALASKDRDGRPGVTTDLNLTCLAPGKPPKVRAVAKALKVGKRLGYVQVDVYGDDGTPVAQGRMTKFMGGA